MKTIADGPPVEHWIALKLAAPRHRPEGPSNGQGLYLSNKMLISSGYQSDIDDRNPEAEVLFICALMYRLSWHQPWNGRACVKLRFLVEENGEVLWRTVRARVLVGWPSSDRTVTPRHGSMDEEESAILQTWKGLLIVYSVGDRKAGDQKIGSLQIWRSWEELKAAVPPKIFEEAAVAGGYMKPVRYREVPLSTG